MILEPFQYFSPTSLSEAQEILMKHGDEGKILAGGQSLIPIMKMGLEIPYIVDIKNISELSFIDEQVQENNGKKTIEIGALTKYTEIEESDIVQKNLPLLSMTVSGIGHPLVRNRGTIGGSLSHCDPAADLCVTSLALNGFMNIYTPDGKNRKLSASEFFKGALTTDLRKGEILQSIIYQVPVGKSGYDIQKLTLGHGDFPLLVVSVMLTYDGSKFNHVRIAYGGVGETAIRSTECESLLQGKESITDSDIDEVSERAMETLEAPLSLELSSDYTRKMIDVYTGRALRNALRIITG